MPIDETETTKTGADGASRAKRLRIATGDTHDRLDQAIMRKQPFASRESYGRFLMLQYAFHRDIDTLYEDASLDAVLPDLKGRRRLPLIVRDLADLGVPAPAVGCGPAFPDGAPPDLPTALGWLYVAEGSNLGAAFLLKEASKIGLTESFGARHLGAAPEGRGLHWRTFTAALDALPLTVDQEPRVIVAAEAAFRRVHGLVTETFP